MFEQLELLQASIQAKKDKLNFQLGKRNSIQQDIVKKKEHIIELNTDTDVYSKVGVLLQNVSEFVRISIVSKLETIVTEALQEIYQDRNLKFIISFESKRNNVEVKFKVHDTILKQDLNVLYSLGGGIKDIISTVLRVMVLEMDSSNKNSSIILDETGKNISYEYQENFGKFLRVLSEKLGRQIILITHMDTIIPYANKVLRIEQNGGKSSVR